MFGDMMGKMKEAKKQMDDIKARLETVYVEGESDGGNVKVKANGNRKITFIQIADGLTETKSTQEIAQLVLIATNEALEKAESVHETEMQSAARSIMPNIPGIFK